MKLTKQDYEFMGVKRLPRKKKKRYKKGFKKGYQFMTNFLDSMSKMNCKLSENEL